MSVCTDFSEISVLIPGYSVEDLPTDLPEEGAASLLNAVACAWHPALLRRSTSIPLFRQAESLSGYPGRRIILVPAPSESWMPHEWRSVLRGQGHLVIAGCTSRDEWLAAIDEALQAELPSRPDDSSANDSAGNSFSTDSSAGDDCAPDNSDAECPTDECPNTEGLTPVLPAAAVRDHFFSLGIVLLLTQLLSRRRHHFVDPDTLLLGRESRLAADAWFAGDETVARQHLARCFEHVLETRERFYPMKCYLVDICIPGDTEEAAAILELLKSPLPINLFATGKDLAGWAVREPLLGDAVRNAVSSGLLCLLTGHDTETRTSLGSMATTVGDLERCRTVVSQLTGHPPRHWARRRYGLTASLPTLLQHFEFDSALHVALDDGLYPDRERSQFEWQAPDGSQVAAASRIPLAIDSASGFLRFADRFNESMQDDTTAALFLARLPQLKSPWLLDLQTAASYAPVLGEFATMDQLCYAGGGTRLAERHEHSDYLAPFLIQSSVLKTEPPVSGPAVLRQLNQRLDSIRTVLGIGQLMKVQLSTTEFDSSLAGQEQQIADLELRHVDVVNESADRIESQRQSAISIADELDRIQSSLLSLMTTKVPNRNGNVRGLFLINALPFGRFTVVEWPEQWNRPAQSSVIELSQRTGAAERLLVKMPPGGFAWLTEHEPGQAPHPILEPMKGEARLAESLTLRNRHFEVTLSERTGGIAEVAWHHQRGNRLSQQACFRFEREQTLPDDGSGEVRKASYAVSQLVSQRVIESGTVFAEVETVVELLSPVDHSLLCRVRQRTAVDRAQPRIRITLTFEDLAHSVKGNPWLTYFGCRFAWDNESSAVTRGVMGQTGGFRAERFESPDYVEISDPDRRLVIATHGRPYHRRSGLRMLDSLLIVEGESAREFQFTIDFDQPFPLRTAADVLTPVISHPTSGVAPAAVSSGWVLGLTARNVELVRTDHRIGTAEHSEELILLLSETEGTSGQCLVKTARRPSAAFACNADRTQKVALEISDQGVTVELKAFQVRSIVMVF